MNHERVSEAEARDPTQGTKPAFNVVVAYENRSAVTRAMKIFGGLVHQFGDDFEFQCDLWRFDVLELPVVREAAAFAGADADLLIISARGDNDLPASVKDWLNQSIVGKTPGSAALVALLESHCKLSDANCRTRQFLQSAADRSLLRFFFHEENPPQTSLELTCEVLEERAHAISPAIQRILQPVRGWGINE